MIEFKKGKQISKSIVFMYRNISWNKITSYGKYVQKLYKENCDRRLEYP